MIGWAFLIGTIFGFSLAILWGLYVTRDMDINNKK